MPPFPNMPPWGCCPFPSSSKPIDASCLPNMPPLPNIPLLRPPEFEQQHHVEVSVFSFTSPCTVVKPDGHDWEKPPSDWHVSPGLLAARSLQALAGACAGVSAGLETPT